MKEREEPAFRFEDRRHSARTEDAASDDAVEVTVEPAEPALVRELRKRAEDAEQKLREYSAALRQVQSEQDQFRERMTRDIARRVELSFGGLVSGLVESLDDLDLALTHATASREGEALAQGVALARNRFLQALEKAGVERIDPAGTPFDPQVAEAVRLEPVDAPELDGVVVETAQAGFRLGDRVIRPARVTVGRYAASE